jgi:methionyl-tRNA formyltransferase
MEKKNLRIVFMGTPEFAVPSLKGILGAAYEVVGVITAPDKPSGRGKKMSVSAVKHFAAEQGLKILQPQNLKDDRFLAELKSLRADLQVVVAFRMLPEKVWAMPSLGTFNLHASLLPQYRGAAPINHAIINGEEYTGLTTFFLDASIDTGKIIRQKKMRIAEDENAGDLHDRMMYAGADLVVETIERIRSGEIHVIMQSEMIPSGELLRSAPKIFKADCKINWEHSIERIHNFIRGLSPYPTAFTHFVSPSGNDFLVKIFRTTMEIVPHQEESGKIIIDGQQEIKIVVSGGYVHINELQMAGRKRMKVDEFLRGTPLTGDWKVR